MLVFCTLQNLTIDYWFYRVTKTRKVARSEGAPLLRIIHAIPPLFLLRSLLPSPNSSFILPSSEKLPWPRRQAFMLGPKLIPLLSVHLTRVGKWVWFPLVFNSQGECHQFPAQCMTASRVAHHDGRNEMVTMPGVRQQYMPGMKQQQYQPIFADRT